MHSRPPLLDMQRVTVMRGAKTVLRDLSLRVAVGEHIAILGPNGCGKSTLIKTIAREIYPLARPESHITLMGRERWTVAELRSILGIVELDLAAHCSRPITAHDLVLSGLVGSVGLWPHHKVTEAMRAKAGQALDRMEVAHLAARSIRELSSGELRRLVIARALVHDPHALLLDEPSNSLDLSAQHQLRSAMRKLAADGIGIVLVTHHLADIIPEIERVVLMRAGKIEADGKKEEILTAANIERLFGVKVTLAQRDGFYHGW